ncbi:MAG: MarR family transcriptional regulator [Deltaproteobacteria bacterium]|nr:MarR family transcriptional regulator [Deltaproteobacteria bacterium]MBU49724.1 MarR family transcriptional regulator [Deltaproteobacteria bacterium]|tara:strand:+ start:8877 stop:9368 length:492 start_codon:yes stop_codon:yes gene_type:complete
MVEKECTLEADKIELEEAKRGSVGQVLMRCARLFNERGIARVRELKGFESIRPAHLALFPYIDFDGTRLTELARRMEISKQAVSQVIAELESFGVVERIPDPRDGRARLIRFSKSGREGMKDGLITLKQIEEEIAASMGQDSMETLHTLLLSMLDWLESKKYG